LRSHFTHLNKSHKWYWLLVPVSVPVLPTNYVHTANHRLPTHGLQGGGQPTSQPSKKEEKPPLRGTADIIYQKPGGETWVLNRARP